MEAVSDGNLMAHDYFSDFRSYIDELERRGKLHRWTRPVNKDTELMPLMRSSIAAFPTIRRQAFLFENVVDSRGTATRYPRRHRHVWFVTRNCRDWIGM